MSKLQQATCVYCSRDTDVHYSRVGVAFQATAVYTIKRVVLAD